MWTAKQSVFFSKSLNKSRTSHAHKVCEVREKLASLPSLALRFQPHSRHFVWLLAGTWIHKNTHCFVVYHRCWFTDKFTHLQKKWVSALGKKRRSRHRGNLNRLVQKVWQEKSSALVPCHRNCHCPNPGPTPTPIPHPPWNRGQDLHVEEEFSGLLYPLSISFNTVCFILKIILIFKENGEENG